jgi:hypothetical protein
MKPNTLRCALAGVLASVAMGLAGADSLELRSGATMDGVLIGASGETLYLRSSGRVRQVPIEDVTSIRFEKRPLAQTTTGAEDTGSRRAVIVGAGATMNVSLPSSLAEGNLRKGERFTATLSDDFKSGSVLVAPAGSEVFGEVVAPAPGTTGLVLTEMAVSGERLAINTRPRDLPTAGESTDRVEFRIERPFTFRLASTQ